MALRLLRPEVMAMRDTHHYTLTLSAREYEIVRVLVMRVGLAWDGVRAPDGRGTVTIRRSVRLYCGDMVVPSDEDLARLAAEAELGQPIDYDGPPVGGEQEAGR